METTEFVIANSAKAFKILSDTLYNDKVLAVIRELVCNAWDSHIEAGNTSKPIDVRLPTYHDPLFYVRDYGVSMDDDTVRNLYTTFFGSSKVNQATNGVNDGDKQLVVGHLGLGSKAPFCYVDKFMVTTYLDGTARNYAIYKNDSDIPCITLVNELETTEPNGVKVSLVTKSEDITTFLTRMEQVSRYFPVKPNVSIEGSTNIMVNEPFEPIDTGEGYSYRLRTRGPYVRQSHTAILGVIGYDIPDSFFADYYIKRFNVEIKFPVGELDIAASREALSIDPKTANNIHRAIKICTNHYIKSLQDAIDAECKTHFDAYVWLHDNDVMDLIDVLTFNGLPIKTRYKLNDDTHYLVSYTRGCGYYAGTVSVNYGMKFIIDDIVGMPSLRKQKVGSYVILSPKKYDKVTHVSRGKTRTIESVNPDWIKNTQAWIKENFGNNANISFLSEFRTTRSASTSSVRKPRVKGMAYVVSPVSYVTHRSVAYNVKRSAYEMAIEVLQESTDTVLYFSVKDNERDLSNTVRLLSDAKNAQLVTDDDVKIAILSVSEYKKLVSAGVIDPNTNNPYDQLTNLLVSKIDVNRLVEIGKASNLAQAQNIIRLKLGIYQDVIGEFDQDMNDIMSEELNNDNKTSAAGAYAMLAKRLGVNTDETAHMVDYEEMAEKVVARYWIIGQLYTAYGQDAINERLTKMRPILRSMYFDDITGNRSDGSETVAATGS